VKEWTGDSVTLTENTAVIKTSATVEDTDAAISAVMYLVVTKHWVALCLDPDTGHCIVKDLIVLNDTKATVVHQDASILSTPDLVASYQRVASRSVKNHNTPMNDN